MTDAEEMAELRACIAATFTRREQLKQAVGEGFIPARQGFRELEAIDKALSALDSRFKQLWDKQQQCRKTGSEDRAYLLIQS